MNALSVCLTSKTIHSCFVGYWCHIQINDTYQLSLGIKSRLHDTHELYVHTLFSGRSKFTWAQLEVTVWIRVLCLKARITQYCETGVLALLWQFRSAIRNVASLVSKVASHISKESLLSHLFDALEFQSLLLSVAQKKKSDNFISSNSFACFTFCPEHIVQESYFQLYFHRGHTRLPEPWGLRPHQRGLV